MGFAEKGRDHRQDQDEDQPGVEGHQAGAQEEHGNDVLYLGEHLRHEDGAARCLTAGAFELVIKGGVFKLVEVQPGGVANQVYRGAVGEEVAQQAVQQRNAPVEQVGSDGQGKLQPDQEPEIIRIGYISVDQADHFIDDLFADIKGDEGHG